MHDLTRYFLSTLLAAAGMQATARAEPFSLEPYWVEAGKPLTLTVGGFLGLCDPSFSHHAAVVQGGKIRLEVLAQNDPLARCINDTLRYNHTDFQLPALAAGSYEVSVFTKPACAYTEPFCPFALDPQPAGTLSVTDSAKLSSRRPCRTSVPPKY